MSDKKKTNKKKISTLVKQQAPQFVLENHPKFTEFLTSYFLFLESAEMTLQTFTEIDHILLETDATANNFILFERTDDHKSHHLVPYRSQYCAVNYSGHEC